MKPITIELDPSYNSETNVKTISEILKLQERLKLFSFQQNYETISVLSKLIDSHYEILKSIQETQHALSYFSKSTLVTTINMIANIDNEFQKKIIELSKFDFRIAVVGQQIEKLIFENKNTFSKLSDEYIQEIPEILFSDGQLKHNLASDNVISDANLLNKSESIFSEHFIQNTYNQKIKHENGNKESEKHLLYQITFIINIIILPDVAYTALNHYYKALLFIIDLFK
ncbi:hypothetical protein C5754_12090 [Listeria monocytogenes]|nr:hypothetical protein [Listeria monocytogenes]EAG4642405.1 hypothetical protein [Listeria monocytogenes]MCM64897.1 hypothetical protein [Listeria monocytogenes]